MSRLASVFVLLATIANVVFIFLLLTIPAHAKPIDELRKLQDRGYSWQLYISEKDDDPAVCVLLQRGQENIEGCADSISGAVAIAKKKIRK